MLFLGSTAPLAFLRFGGINLNLFDVLSFASFLIILVRYGYTIVSKKYLIFSFILCLGALISSLFAVDKFSSFGQSLQWIFILFIVIPVLYRISKESEDVFLVAVGVTLGLGVLAGMSILLWLSGNFVLRGGRFGGVFENPQMLGFQISCTFPYLLSVLFYSGKFYKGKFTVIFLKLFALLIGALSISLLVFSASRSSIAAFVVSITVYVLVVKSTGIVDLVKRASSIIPLFVLGFGGLIVLASNSESLLVADRIRDTFAIGSEDVYLERTRTWYEALFSGDVTGLILGLGLDNYQIYSFTSDIEPHNLYILIFSEGGVLMLVSLLSLLALLYYRYFLYLKSGLNKYRNSYIVSASLASFIAFIVISVFNTQSIARMYWLSYALVFAAPFKAER